MECLNEQGLNNSIKLFFSTKSQYKQVIDSIKLYKQSNFNRGLEKVIPIYQI